MGHMADGPTDLDAEHSQVTTDHSTVQRWAERRDGRPASLADGEDDRETREGTLGFRFGGTADDPDIIPWERFFRRFDEANLAFVYEEEGSDGDVDTRYEFVDRRSL